MLTFFREGGFGMFPTLIFGVLLVAAAVAYAVRPERRFVPLLVTLGVVTLGSGCLGVVMGFISTFQYLHQVAAADQFTIMVTGVAESLTNIVLALVLLVLASLVTAVGALRIARRGSPELAA